MADFFQKLFGTKTKTKDQSAQQKPIDLAITAPLSDQQINSIITNQYLKYEIKQLVAGVGQSGGKQREHNEDSLLALTSTISGGWTSMSVIQGFRRDSRNSLDQPGRRFRWIWPSWS